MYNQYLINYYIKYINQILDTVERIEETKSGYMLARTISDISFVKALISDHRLNSKRGYNKKMIADLESFDTFLSEVTWDLADLIIVR